MRSALEHVIKNKFPESDIAMLRAAMINNRWKTIESLPNWFFKTRGSLNAISLLTMKEKCIKVESYQEYPGQVIICRACRVGLYRSL